MLTGIITNVEQVAVAESISAVQSNMPSTTVQIWNWKYSPLSPLTEVENWKKLTALIVVIVIVIE